MITIDNSRTERLQDGRYRVAYTFSNLSIIMFFNSEKDALNFLKDTLKSPKEIVYDLFVT